MRDEKALLEDLAWSGSDLEALGKTYASSRRRLVRRRRAFQGGLCLALVFVGLFQIFTGPRKVAAPVLNVVKTQILAKENLVQSRPLPRSALVETVKGLALVVSTPQTRPYVLINDEQLLALAPPAFLLIQGEEAPQVLPSGKNGG